MIEPSFALIEHLFVDHIPENTNVTIERHKLKGQTQYLYRLQYRSKSSGRTMCMTAKGTSLPFSRDDVFKFYLRQLLLTPSEQGREFSRLAWLERRARQDMFLALGKLGNPRVASEQGMMDTLSYEKYI